MLGRYTNHILTMATNYKTKPKFKESYFLGLARFVKAYLARVKTEAPSNLVGAIVKADKRMYLYLHILIFHRWISFVEGA